MGCYEDIDYPRMTKANLGLGLALFLSGAIGVKAVLTVSDGAIPGWERTLFFDAEWLGITSVLFSPTIFGIMLPPTEQMVDTDPRFPSADETLVLEPDCARCPVLVDCRNRISWGVGPDDATVMVVGEAPSAGNPDAEHWRGGNWAGMSYTVRYSGRRIRETVAAVGYESGVFYTNAVKCFPSDGEGSSRAPTAAEEANCRDHLVSELEAVDPDVVVPIGRHATESALALDSAPLDGFLDTVLDPIESERFGYTMVLLLHPSYRDVWLSRLGYELEGHLTDLEALLPER